jgi:hypothetical protein
MTGGTGINETTEDLLLLEAAVELAQTPVWIPAARAFERLHGRLPRPRDMRRLRRALSRLQRDGLLQVVVSLDVEPTPDGRVAVELLRHRRRLAGKDRNLGELRPQPLSPTASIAS